MKADCVLLATLMAVVAADFYNSKYDSFDVQPLLENDRILLSYTKCFLDEGPCTPDAKDFKSKRHITFLLKMFRFLWRGLKRQILFER